ncbi:MAG: Nramp family divalent metal transporter [Flavobacteriales bacterium]
MKKALKNIGPGLLYAAAAIGVSHLVQSTRAGASYGITLLIVVILANILKFPFFEYGPRYAAATGKNLIEGYKKLGSWAIAVFLIMTFGTMFVIQAAVTVVTAGLAERLFLFINEMQAWNISGIILIICLSILLFGKYYLLDRIIKVIVSVLAITTIFALFFASFSLGDKELIGSFSFSDTSDIAFLIALVGWMPAPLDLSVWHSVWSLAKRSSENEKINLKEALLDFKIGYWGTAFLAICFLLLGAFVMYGTGEELSSKGTVFAGQLIELYTTTIGKWSFWIIAIAAFTTMFSTTLTCLDAFPRVLSKTCTALIPSLSFNKNNKKLYWFWNLFVSTGTMVILTFYLKNMGTLIDFITTISFLTAPAFAIMNYMVINGNDVPNEFKPGKTKKIISWLGILFLVGFGVFYLVS